MQELLELLRNFELVDFVKNFGYVGVLSIVFAESGLFFGFFLPGDSLLVIVGLLASQGVFSLPFMLFSLFVAAVLGDNVGYYSGAKLGRKLETMPDKWYYKKEHLFAAEQFYAQHGGKALILARFLPAVRTFAPIVAGMVKMDYSKFFFYNITGGAAWVLSLTLVGYYLGEIVGPEIDKYIIPIVLFVIIISILPTYFHMKSSKKHKKVELKVES